MENNRRRALFSDGCILNHGNDECLVRVSCHITVNGTPERSSRRLSNSRTFLVTFLFWFTVENTLIRPPAAQRFFTTFPVSI